MSEHKFKAFLQSRNWNEKQSKYFVDIALTESTLPDFKSWKKLKNYLEGNEAVPEVIEEVEYIWKLYVDDIHDELADGDERDIDG